LSLDEIQQEKSSPRKLLTEAAEHFSLCECDEAAW
jgi:hypothetical protein